MKEKELFLVLPNKFPAKEILGEMERLRESGELSWIQVDDEVDYPEMKKYIEHYAKKYFKESGNSADFASAVMSFFEGDERLDEQLMWLLWNSGCKDVRVGLCCRDDIPIEMLSKCLKSEDHNIIEHVAWNNRVSKNECKKLLLNELPDYVKDSIKRAINTRFVAK